MEKQKQSYSGFSNKPNSLIQVEMRGTWKNVKRFAKALAIAFANRE
ncbi:MAG: hypothetical protein ABIT08_00985 [Bacteroidia bacterium]